ncbi:MAG TPA: hypothetical protein VGD40_10760 [Chryseosolibacter sp.]
MKKNAAIVFLLITTILALGVAYHENQVATAYRLELLETEIKLKESVDHADMQRRIAEQNHREAIHQHALATQALEAAERKRPRERKVK